jgi:hypothetical protein
MPSAFFPDGGPPRLIRFTTLSNGMLSILDVEKNLLCIDKAQYDTLTKDDQEMLLRTQLKVIMVPTTWN